MRTSHSHTDMKASSVLADFGAIINPVIGINTYITIKHTYTHILLLQFHNLDGTLEIALAH